MKISNFNYVLDTNWAIIYHLDGGVSLRYGKPRAVHPTQFPVKIYKPNIEDIYTPEFHAIVEKLLGENRIIISGYEYNTTLDGVLIVYGKGVNLTGQPRARKKPGPKPKEKV